MSLVTCLTLAVAAATTPLTGNDLAGLLAAELEPLVDQARDENALAGFCIAVVKDDEIAYASATGPKNVESGEPVVLRSLFHMASVTKLFVATAVMQLHDLGELDIEDPVVQHLPYFRLADERYQEITIRHMLKHISGMPDVRDYEWGEEADDDGALERYVRSLGSQQMLSMPGSSYSYSNMAYEVLGDVIAKVSGETFEDYVQASILEPLQMHDTTLLKRAADPDLLTTPHRLGDSSALVVSHPYPYNRKHAPSSTLISNVPDMARFALAFLQSGELDGEVLLDPATCEFMFAADEKRFSQVGLGWHRLTIQGRQAYRHSGADVGYVSDLIIIPAASLGVVCMSNTNRAPVPRLSRAALEIALRTAPE